MLTSEIKMKAINIVIIEDDEFTKFGIKCAITSGESLPVRIVGETKFGLEGLRIVEEILPDILICDIGLPDINGIEIIEEIKGKFAQRIKILVVSGNINKEIVTDAINKGADSFFAKSSGVEKIVEAIHVTAKGESWFDSNISKILVNSLRGDAVKSPHDLTKRELAILKLIGQGLQNEEIANKLCISDGTVRSHTHNIFAKLHVNNRTQAVIKGVELDIISIKKMGSGYIDKKHEAKELKIRNFISF